MATSSLIDRKDVCMDSLIAARFADDWVAAWNAHDVDAVLKHYTDAFSMSSPLIVQVAGEASGMLHGKAAVRAYWRRGSPPG